MSEYLRKKAVLEFIKARKAKFAGSYKEIEHGAYLELDTIEAYLESGTFNADESEPDDYESMVLLDAHDQIQRLREALGHIHAIAQSELDVLQYESQRKTWEKILLTAEEALSTTTEPTNAAKVERFECPCCGCVISINAPKGAGNDA